MMEGEEQVGVFTADRALVVRSWDQWLADATGIPAEVACGRTLASLFPEIESRGVVTRLRRVAEEGAVEVLAPAFHRFLIPCAPREPSAHFERMQQHVTLAPLREGNQIVGVTVTVRDVTLRREREREIAGRLRSGDEHARLRAVEALAAQEASPDLLVRAFDDASWRVRNAAVDAVMQQRGGGVVEILTRLLREHHRDLAVLNATLSALAASGEEVLPPLLELLRSPDPDLRVYVALALGLRGDPGAVPALVDALADEEPNVRFHALEALGRLRARRAAAAVAEIAESGDFFLSFAALEALAAIGDQTVTPRILPLLDDPLLRSAALSALGALGGEEVVAPLLALLAREADAAGEVAVALAAIHARYESRFGDGWVIAALARATTPAEAGAHLLAAASSATPGELRGLVVVLSWLALDQADELLVSALSRPETRAAAADGLVQLGSGVVSALVEAVGGLEPDARRAAVLALGRIGSPAAIPALLELLEIAPEAAGAVAEALGAIGDRRAFEPLVRLLDHPSAMVRQAAVGALNSIGHPALRERVCALLHSPSAPVRESAARIAGYFGYQECADDLVALCRDADEGTRRAALEHVVFLSDPRVPEVLHEVLHDGDGPTRGAAARAAGRLAPMEAEPLLAAALNDPDLWVRFYAARSAGALALQPLAPRLQEVATRDPAPPVRIAAVQALGELAAPGTAATLRALAADADLELRTAALAALGRSAEPAALDVLKAALASDDPQQQRAALDALRPEAAAALAEWVAGAARGTRDPELARAAALALVRASSPEAVRLLCGLAAAPGLRDLCVEALVRVRDEHLAVLAEELRGGEEPAREAILAALGHQGSAEAERLAAGALNDPSPTVRQMAAHTLCRLDLRAAIGGG